MTKRKQYLPLLALGFVLINGTALWAQSVALPMGHWAYDFFDRMAISGAALSYSVCMHPITRKDAVKIVDELQQQAARHEIVLSRIEQAYMQRAVEEFQEDRPERHPGAAHRVPHLYAWRQGEKQVFLDGVMGLSLQQRGRDAAESTRSIQGGYYGAIIRGKIGRLAFYSDNRIFGEQGGGPYLEDYDRVDAYPMNTSDDGSTATWDQSVSTLTTEFKGIRIQYGRDRLRWGPSRSGGLMLSGHMPAFDFISLKAEMGKARFQFFHGALRGPSAQKWLAGHRLEISLGHRGHIGLSEMIVYGNRGIESAYMNPVLPFLISEHSLGDKDNVSMAVDGSWTLGPGIQLFTEIFVDDLVAPWTLFTDKWSNKVAFLTGLRWKDPLKLNDALFSMEYHRINPYVYTHKYDVNVYSHFGTGIGSALQPNSDYIRLDLTKTFAFGLAAGVQYERRRHATGDRAVPHMEADGDKKNFLKGPRDEYHNWGGHLQWEIRRDVWLKARIHYYEENQDLVSIASRRFLHCDVFFTFNW